MAMAPLKPGGAEHHGTAEEGDSLITSSLPRREGWWKPFFLFQGFWVTSQTAKSVTLVQARFRPRADDTILASFPKCGTTWLKALAFTLANRSRHAVTDASHPLRTRNPHDLVPFLELPDRARHPVEELEAIPSPRLLSTHVPYTSLPSGAAGATSRSLGCRVVYLCREPKDMAVSTWHYYNKVGQGFSIEFDKAFELLCEGVSIFGPFWEHYLGYWKRSVAEPGRVLFMKYDEMMADPTKHVRMLAEFLRVPFTAAEENAGVPEEVVRLCSFQNLRGLPVNSTGKVDLAGGWPMDKSLYFRSAKIGDWRSHLTEEMAKKLDRIVQEKFKGSGLSF